MTRQLLKFFTAIMVTLLALVVLWQFRLIVLYILVSLALAAALRPLADRLVGRKFVVRAAWVLLYVVVLGSFCFLLFLTIGSALSEIQDLARNLSVQDAWILPGWLEESPLQNALIARLPPPSMLFEAVTGDEGQLVLPALLGISQGIGSLVSGVVIILILSIYWSINQIHFERLWLSLLPSGQRKQARGVWRVIEPDLGAYIRAEAIQSLLVGVLLGLVCWLIGSPYPALLGLVGAFASLIPVVGMPLAVLSVLLVGLLTSLPLSLFTALFALVVFIALGLWVKPRLFSHKWNNPMLTMVLLIALADAFGFVGIIVAPPLSVVCQIVWDRLVSHRHRIGAAALVSDLKDRQARLWDTIRLMADPPPPLVTSSLERLSLLIENAEPVLQATLSAESPEPFHPSQPVTADVETPDSQKPGRNA